MRGSWESESGIVPELLRRHYGGVLLLLLPWRNIRDERNQSEAGGKTRESLKIISIVKKKNYYYTTKLNYNSS